MAIWIQSLSWALIYALGQGFVVYASLWLVLKLIPATSANAKYWLSLSSLTILLVWFAATWWQQFHALLPSNGYYAVLPQGGSPIFILPQLPATGAIEKQDSHYSLPSSVSVIYPWLAAFYFAGLAFMLIRLSGGMLQLLSLRKKGISQPDTAIVELLISLKKRLYFNGPAQLFISAKANVPLVIGFLKPVILMPAAALAQLSPAQLETILLHELAHIKRHDYVINILQTVVETILFFNPFVWMISAIIRREREHCCDDLVLDHTREPLFYATALAAVANHSYAASAFAVAASGQSHHLFNRIKRIIEMKKHPFSYSRLVAAILIVASVTCSVASLTPSFALPKKDKPAEASSATPSKPSTEATLKANEEESDLLIKRLTEDHLIDAEKGFTIEKNNNGLFIDGTPQTPEIAAKYLRAIKQERMYLEVYPFQEWLSRHPKQIQIPFIFPAIIRNYHLKAGSGC